MRKLRSTFTVALAAAMMVAAMMVAGCTKGAGGPGPVTGLQPTGAPATGLHNDAFPCNLASQAEIAAVAGSAVAYDEIEPDGQTCVYSLTDEPTHVDISVLNDEDKTQWTELMQTFPTWAAGADLGGRAVAGLGDDAYLTETPGYAGQLDVWKADKLLRITVDVAHRLTDADADKLVSLGRTVAGRL
jgi:hypothetical protein